MSGTFPEGIYHLPFLENLVLSHGNLTGPMPNEMLFTNAMRHLHIINLGYNHLTGTLTSRVPKNMYAILLSGNEISGTIPPQMVGGARDLRELRLADNQLSGPIPTEFGLLRNLWYLDLSGNNIRGPLVPSLQSSKSLETLWLHQNQITGTIPWNFKNLSNLRDLRLSMNTQLGGTIPESLLDLQKLAVLEVSDCDLQGTIPASIGGLRRLEILDLSNNQLNGTVPFQFGSLTRIRDVRLNGNQLTGSMPDGFCAASPRSIIKIQADCAAASVSATQSGVNFDDDSNKTMFVEFRCSCCTHCCQPDGTECLQNNNILSGDGKA